MPTTTSSSRPSGEASGTGAAACRSGSDACRPPSTKRSSRSCAERAGLATREVVTAAATVDDDALLVLRGAALPAADLPSEQIDEAFLVGAWRALALLDGAKIAHQQIDATTLAVLDGGVGFVDFGRANVAPDAMRLLTDRVQLLVTTASLAGSERALRSATEALVADGLVELLPYLQEAALSPQLRRQLKATETDVDDFRDEVVAATGIEPPDPVKLRRVTWWSAVQLALLVFVSYTIIDAASGVDWGEVRSSVADSAWGWIVAGIARGAAPALDAGADDARVGSRQPSLRPGLHDATRNGLHESRAAVEPRPDGRQHPLLPAAGALPADRGRVGSDRLVRRHGRAGCAARDPARSSPSRRLRSTCRPRPAAPGG